MPQHTHADYRVFLDETVDLAISAGIDEEFDRNLPAELDTTGHALVSWRDSCRPSGSNASYTMTLNGNTVGDYVVEASRMYTRHQVVPASSLNPGGQNTIQVRVDGGSGTGSDTLEIGEIVLLYKTRIET